MTIKSDDRNFLSIRKTNAIIVFRKSVMILHRNSFNQVELLRITNYKKLSVSSGMINFVDNTL